MLCYHSLSLDVRETDVFIFALCSFSSPLDSHSLENCHPDCLAVHLFVWQQLHPPSILLLMFIIVPVEPIT